MALSAHRASGRSTSIAGLGVLATIGVLALWFVSELEIETQPLPAQPSAMAAAVAAGKRMAATAPKPLSAFDDTLQRPLFEPSRRPRPRPDVAMTAKDADTPGTVSLSAEGLRYIGLMRTAKGGARVLLRSVDQPLGTWVEKGGEISGWTVREVGDRQVMIEANGTLVELKIYAPERAAARAAR